MQWLQEYDFLYVGTLCDVWWFKTNFLLKYCMQWLQEYCFHMLEPSLINQNKFNFEETNAVIVRVLFSSCWDIRSDQCSNIARLLFSTLCDKSKRIFFWSIVCIDCKNTVFHMLGPSLMNQNEFSLEVTNAVIARIIFSACWNIVWCIKTNFLFKYCKQWLQEYCFLHFTS